MINRKALRKLECWNASTSKSPTSSSVPNPSQEDTSNTSTPNVSREYSLALHANSYSEIRSLIQAPPQQGQMHLLHPNRECIQEVLSNTINTIHINLISKYFDHSETASQLCLHLHQCTHLASAMYAPLLDLFTIVEIRHITQSDCDHVFRLFQEFDGNDNPIPDSNTFTNIQSSLSELKTQLDYRLQKSLSRVRLFRHATACVPYTRAAERRKLATLAHLDAAAKCAYVLSNDLGTIDSLVARLRAAVEGDKLLIRLGLERGRERFPIQEVLRQLCKSHGSFLHQLEDLEEHICLCFYTVNKARSLLLQEICNHQNL